MIVSVLNRDIHVDDTVAKKFNQSWGYDLCEKDIILYLDARYHNNDIEGIVHKLSDVELTKLVHDGVLSET